MTLVKAYMFLILYSNLNSLNHAAYETVYIFLLSIARFLYNHMTVKLFSEIIHVIKSYDHTFITPAGLPIG